MISESIDYAFDDMNERVWTEAKFKSEELLPAVAGALELVGDRLEQDERTAIASAAERVREVLEAEPHDAVALKKANAALDEATRPWRRCWWKRRSRGCEERPPRRRAFVSLKTGPKGRTGAAPQFPL